jgi:hypothetical protein
MSDFRIGGISDKTMTLLRERAREHGWPVEEKAPHLLTIAVENSPRHDH